MFAKPMRSGDAAAWGLRSRYIKLFCIIIACPPHVLNKDMYHLAFLDLLL